jgi:hypothetical protein
VANTGIGDTDGHLAEDQVGILVNELNTDGYERALDELDWLRTDAGLAERCRESARGRFHLERIGGAKYKTLYGRIVAMSD